MVDGFYPDVRNGTVYLKAGDVWKYGETTQLDGGRYSQSFLDANNLLYVEEFWGNQTEIKVMEKMKIYNYYLEHGVLPPGNKIFR